MRFILVLSICFCQLNSIAQLNVKAGLGHSFIKLMDRNNDNLIHWNHTNRWFIGGDYIFGNNIILGVEFSDITVNHRFERQNTKTHINGNCLETKTSFNGRFNASMLSFNIGYQWKVTDKFSVNTVAGIAANTTRPGKIEHGMLIERFYSETCGNHSDSQPIEVIESFYSGPDNYYLDRSFEEKMNHIFIFPIVSVEFLYSLNKNLKPLLSLGYTLLVGHDLRFGAGIVYTLNYDK